MIFRPFFRVLLMIISACCIASATEVTILAGGSDQIRQKIETILTRVLNQTNKVYELNTSLTEVRSFFTDQAYIDFFDLIRQTKMYAGEKKYQTYLLATQDGFFEVRNIKVRVEMGRTKGIPFNNLVFVLNKQGLIVNAHFALEKHHYEDIVRQGKELKDIAFREKILSFIEMRLYFN